MESEEIKRDEQITNQDDTNQNNNESDIYIDNNIYYN